MRQRTCSINAHPFRAVRPPQISNKDVITTQKNDAFKYLTIEEVAGVAGFVWKVDGQIRTVTSDDPVDSEGVALALDTSYQILNRKMHTVTGDCVGCPIYLRLPGEDYVKISNPPVDVAALEGVVDLDVVDLPAFGSVDLPSIESADDYPIMGEWIKSDENALLNTTGLDACDGLPDFRRPLPWDEAAAMPGTFQSIFGKSEDGVAFLYDRHATFFENTVENPVSAVVGSSSWGGLSTVAQSWSGRSEILRSEWSSSYAGYCLRPLCGFMLVPTQDSKHFAPPSSFSITRSSPTAGASLSSTPSASTPSAASR